jgi:hypothetical protein
VVAKPVKIYLAFVVSLRTMTMLLNLIMKKLSIFVFIPSIQLAQSLSQEPNGSSKAFVWKKYICLAGELFLIYKDM